ncbi:MAG TPA: endonuclease/exonuclease/phosphatase family protein [Verrucomicrobiae bacterium]|nr:endonuclease/exonuclease/phosphatase family protein [Verrucomicrobiae bacterium]
MFAPLTIGALLLCALAVDGADSFRVATWNLENYLDGPAGSRPAKSAESKGAIQATIRAMKADVLAVQEIGSTNALADLCAAGEFRYREYVSGYDTNIHVAVLSRFPVLACRHHTSDSYLLFGRKHRVSRGFAEVTIQASPDYTFTLFAAHLKSRRPVPEGDEAAMREQEALILRAKVDAVLRANADANVIVLGDFNDVQDAKSTRALIGRGRFSLIDTRPAERPCYGESSLGPRNVTWTYFYQQEDTYQRVDYALLSSGMAREWKAQESYVLAQANWGAASDHRPIVVSFWVENR